MQALTVDIYSAWCFYLFNDFCQKFIINFH